MEEVILEEIRHFIRESRDNRFPESDASYFDEPLVGFAAADDPLFQEFKQVIGDFHCTPAELVALSFPAEPWTPRTVISWVLPISSPTRVSNRAEVFYPSALWAQTRHFGETCNSALRRHLVNWIHVQGCQAAAPQLLPAWREFGHTPVGIASTWSERHAAYVAGLGTFSLNDALITPRGIAHRLGSVITDLPLSPSFRPYPERRANCLYYREGTCGVCIRRCPVGALSTQGHDKNLCREHVYGTIPAAVGERYGVTSTGCGLCQTKVPCEGAIPPGRTSYPL